MNYYSKSSIFVYYIKIIFFYSSCSHLQLYLEVFSLSSIDDFLRELNQTTNNESLQDFCRKKVLHGIPHVFINREDDYYNFRKEISNQFDISFHEVFITGSGKLGFSPFKNTIFNLDSDIDVALISNKLFDNIMQIISNFQIRLREKKSILTQKDQKKYHIFLEYIALGWIRPDLLPIEWQVTNNLKTQWFDFFESLSHGKSSVGNYKVSAGIFKNHNSFERYTISGFNQIKGI